MAWHPGILTMCSRGLPGPPRATCRDPLCGHPAGRTSPRVVATWGAGQGAVGRHARLRSREMPSLPGNSGPEVLMMAARAGLTRLLKLRPRSGS